MKSLSLFSVIFLLLMIPNSSQAQYWFGIKAGGHLSMNDYLSETYSDTFDINSNYNFQTGAIFSYTANRRYSVQAEVYYKKVRRELENTIFTVPAKAFTNYHFISAPFMLRVNIHFGNAPFYMYVNGGVELNYWVGGNGGLRLDEFEEFFSEEELSDEFPVTYRFVFTENARKTDTDRWLEEPNRLQYAITGGFGAVYELANGSRFVLDARYSRMHSNFGFNTSTDFYWENYYENFEFRPHQIALTLGYQIEYNADLARKGKSTLRESNR